jgi:hypothetical protein
MCWRIVKAQSFLQRFNGDVYGWLAPLTGAWMLTKSKPWTACTMPKWPTKTPNWGEFFERLRAAGQLDNTLVIICADHGEHLGEKQYMGHSLSIYNELIKVPLIIRDPSNSFPQGYGGWGGVYPTPVPHGAGRGRAR